MGIWSCVSEPELLLSATDTQFAFRKNRTRPKDISSLTISHFAALILRVDIQTKVLYFQELTDIPGRDTKTYCEHSDWLLAQPFEAIFAVIVILAGDTFANKSQVGVTLGGALKYLLT